MNPLNRKMFRQPGMSRQPAGILASSPELSNVVRQRMGQPVQMANGGQNVTNYMSAIKDLAAKGDKATLNNIARDQRLPRSVQMAAANALAGRTVPGQIQTAPVPNADRMAANRANLGALRGRVGQDALTDQAMAQINAANRSSEPSLIDQGIAAANKGMGTVNEFLYGTDTERTPIQTGLRALDTGVRAVTSSAGNLMSGDFMRPVTDYLTTPQLTEEGVRQADIAALTAKDEFGNIPDDGKMPSETLAATATNGSSTFGTPRPVVTTLDPGAQAEADAALPETTIDPATQDPGVRAGVTGTEGGKKTKPKELKPLIDKPTIDLLTKGSLDTPQKSEQALTTGNAVVDKALAILQGSDAPKSEKAKAKALDATIGITGTYKERVEKRKTVLQDLLGERAKDVRTDANYNLMMTGLMIAAGESPDAMVNLAKGLAAGLKGYGDAVGEEAKEISKEDRALTIQSAAEVGAEINSEKAAAIKAEENRIAREHDSKMQDTRLATAIVQTGMQTDSAQQIALAGIRSKEKLAANSFGQNLKLFELKTDASNDMFEKEAKLKKELLDIKANQKSETFKLMEVFKNSATARGQELTDMEAYIAVKAAGTAKGKATDTTLAYQKLTAAGMSTMDAWLLSQSGSVKAIIADLGVNGFEKFVQGKLQGGDSGQGASNEIAKPTNNEEFEALAPGTRYIDPSTGTQFIK